MWATSQFGLNGLLIAFWTPSHRRVAKLHPDKGQTDGEQKLIGFGHFPLPI
jgi:hypothetical protein